MDMITSAALQTVARGATANPTVLKDRARAAVLVDEGYGYLDAYDAMQPVLFWGSVIGAIASGYALKKRRKLPEAATLYSITGVVSLATAWLTRPAWLRPTPAPDVAVAAAGTPAMANLLGWLDKKVEDKSAEKPGWEKAAWLRLEQDMGTTDQAITTLLTANAK